MATEKQLEEIRKELPDELQHKWTEVKNSFKDEGGNVFDFTELDEVLFDIIQFYRKK